MVPPIPQAAWAAPSSTNSAPALSLALASNVKYQLENGKTYTLSNASVSNTVIEVASGRTATVVVPKNVTVTIDDYNNGCSPISLLGSGKLTLVVDGTLTVTGGAAEKGGASQPFSGQSRGNGGAGGAGGYAGIYVPNGTTLIVNGHGTLNARGGDAGDGGPAANGAYEAGGGGGGGAGAGIGGNGGAGGKGGQMGGVTGITAAGGTSGSAGIKAGTIYLYGNGKINAYGGGGGAGGINVSNDAGGGGGYPAAGVGGGGAGGGGGNYCSPGSGFTGAALEGANNVVTHDGVAGSHEGGTNTTWTVGAGYFAASNYGSEAYRGAIGGGGTSYGSSDSGLGGSGGQGGGGGTVYVGNKASVAVANGSYKTATKQKWGTDPTPIYRQSGYDLNDIRDKSITSVSARNFADMNTPSKNSLATVAKSASVKVAGIGAGAGFTEDSNGKYDDTQKVPERVALADSATLYERNTCCF
ncbi:MAG: hypothetical protein HFI72_02365 [Peptococcaceae bacterium]|nr:hypothetical protein [Peptococcaceae bacterium]